MNQAKEEPPIRTVQNFSINNIEESGIIEAIASYLDLQIGKGTGNGAAALQLCSSAPP